MKKLIFAMVMVLTIALVSCNSTPTSTDVTATDSTTVTVDSTAVVAPVADTAKTVK